MIPKCHSQLYRLYFSVTWLNAMTLSMTMTVCLTSVVPNPGPQSPMSYMF